MLSARASLLAGMGTVAPLAAAVVPYAIVAGLVTTSIGLRLAEVLGFSSLVWAGAAHLAAVELLQANAPLAVIVFSMVLINLRMAMYSASLAPYFAPEPARRRWVGAYLISDQAYALSVARFADESHPLASRWWYYLGAAAPIWVAWQSGNIVGALAGGVLPEGVPWHFALPLTFLALLMPAITDRATVAAAIAAGAVATIGAEWPANTGMLAGAAVGLAVGWLVVRRNRAGSR